MALTATVTKKSVSLTQPKQYSIVFNLVLAEESVIVFNQDFPVDYKTGESVASKVSQVITAMQSAIDIYKAEQAIFTAAAMNTAVTNIQGGLSL